MDRIPFLDTLVTRKPNGEIFTSVYRKPTHTDRYLNFNSHHPTNAKRAVVHSLMDRAKNIPSTSADKEGEIKHVENALVQNGFSKKFIHNTIRNRDNTTAEPLNQPIATTVLPYVQGVSERLVRVLNNYNIRGVMKTSTIRQQLSKPKDQIATYDRPNVIYQIPCNDCDQVYIGESLRRFNTRLSEHKESVNDISKHTKSALGIHRFKHDHLPDWENIQILDSEPNYKQRKIKEALYIAENPHNMNRDNGFHIHPVWLNILSSGTQ